MKKFICFLIIFCTLSFALLAEEVYLSDFIDFEESKDIVLLLDHEQSLDEIENYSVIAGAVSLGAFGKFLLDTALVGGAIYSVGSTYEHFKTNRDILAELDYQISLADAAKYQGVATVDDLVALGVDSFTANRINKLYGFYVDAIQNGKKVTVSYDDVKGIDFINTLDSYGYKMQIKDSDVVSGLNPLYVKGFYDSVVESSFMNNVSYRKYFVSYAELSSSGNVNTLNTIFFDDYYFNSDGSLVCVSGQGYYWHTIVSSHLQKLFAYSPYYDKVILDLPLSIYRDLSFTNVPELSDIVSKSYSSFYPCIALDDIFVDALDSSIPVAFPQDLVVTPDLIGDLVLPDLFVDVLDKIHTGINDESIVVSGDLVDVKDNVGDDDIVVPEMDWSWWSWLKNWVSGFFDALGNLLKSLFIPDVGYFNNMFDTLRSNFNSKIPIFSDFNSILSGIIGGNYKETKPSFKITLPQKWGGKTHEIISFSVFDQYVLLIKTIIRAIAWFMFIKRMLRRMPNIIY